ncbi:MAG: sigma-70 family RNA polymerase sigma factor, partial [Fimbriiglobus sp.]
RDDVNADDRRLIDETLGGRPAAFGELVRRYQDRLYNAVLRVADNPDDALDVVQDAFVNAYQSLGSFKGDAEFYTWLYRIAFNTAVSLRRRRKALVSLEAGRDGNGDGPIDPHDPSEETRPGAALERSEDEEQLYAAMAQLSADHRAVLVLKDIEGMKYEQIAEVLGVPIGTVRSRLNRARLDLRGLLAPELGNTAPIEVRE